MSTIDDETPQEAFLIDFADADYKELSSNAGRIAGLLESPLANPNAAAVLDDFLGVIYALVFAKKNQFQDRSDSPTETDVVVRRARDLAKGKVRTDGRWIAGFHFNSAMYRISAVYHRLLKLVVGKEDNMKNLVPKAEKLYQKWTGNTWKHDSTKEIHDEVNNLKHTPKGVHDARRARFQNALASTSELLDLVEAWASVKQA